MAKIRGSLTAIMNAEEISSTYYRIAQYLLANNYLVTRVSIQDVAENCYCSKSTISRFCRKLGYEDFYELNLDLYSSTQKSQDKFNKYIEGNFNQNKDAYFADVVSCIKMAEHHINEDDITSFINALTIHKKVGIFGNLQSHVVAENFQMDLGLCRKIITASTLPEHQKQYIQNADNETLIIIISCSGTYFRNQINLSTYAKDKKPTFMLLTSNKKAKQISLYDKVIFLPCENNYPSQPRIIDLFLNMAAVAYAKTIFTESL